MSSVTYSAEAQAVIRAAELEAAWLHHACLGTEHLLLGLLSQKLDPSVLSQLSLWGVADIAALQDFLYNLCVPGKRERCTYSPPLWTPRAKKVAELAAARSDAGCAVTVLHLLQGLYAERDGIAFQAIRTVAAKALQAQQVKAAEAAEAAAAAAAATPVAAEPLPHRIRQSLLRDLDVRFGAFVEMLPVPADHNPRWERAGHKGYTKLHASAGEVCIELGNITLWLSATDTDAELTVEVLWPRFLARMLDRVMVSDMEPF
jgi:hypothetical protein